VTPTGNADANIGSTRSQLFLSVRLLAQCSLL
jgi:hypothetical protein